MKDRVYDIDGVEFTYEERGHVGSTVSLFIKDHDDDLVLFSPDQLAQFLRLEPQLVPDELKVTATITDLHFLDELQTELEKWRTNSIAFRDRHIKGEESSSSLASAMMADERRYAVDKVLLMIQYLKDGRTASGYKRFPPQPIVDAEPFVPGEFVPPSAFDER